MNVRLDFPTGKSNQTLIDVSGKTSLSQSFILLMSSIVLREREQDEDDLERYGKRLKLDRDATTDVKPPETQEHDHILPPSHALLGIPLPEATPAGAVNFLETNVGISEYVGRESAKVQGIIKQRYVAVLYFSLP